MRFTRCVIEIEWAKLQTMRARLASAEHRVNLLAKQASLVPGLERSKFMLEHDVKLLRAQVAELLRRDQTAQTGRNILRPEEHDV